MPCRRSCCGCTSDKKTHTYSQVKLFTINAYHFNKCKKLIRLLKFEGQLQDSLRTAIFLPTYLATIHHILQHSTRTMHFRFEKSNFITTRTYLIVNSLILHRLRERDDADRPTCAWSVVDRKLIMRFLHTIEMFLYLICYWLHNFTLC